MTQEMVEYLRRMDSVTVRALQQGLRAVRSRFLYMPMVGRSGLQTTTASNLLVSEMCQRAEYLGQEAGLKVPPLPSAGPQAPALSPASSPSQTP